MIPLRYPILLAALLLPGALHAASSAVSGLSQTFTMTASAAIPDGNLNGLVQTITPTTLIGDINSISVDLSLTGGWSGDLYAYLWHGGEVSILINRMGRSASNASGSGIRDLSLTFMDGASSDIHSAPGSPGSSLSGLYQPDARNIHPLSALDTTPRTAGLSTFLGDPAAGEWRLYIADTASGDTATLQSWSINLTGQAIPEPGSAALGALAALTLQRRRRTVGVRA